MRTIFSLLSSFLVMAAVAAADIAIPQTGTPAFTLSIPSGWKALAAGAKTVIQPGSDHPHVQIWATAEPDLAAAIAKVTALIESEVKVFAPSSTAAAVIAGHPAVTLIGRGEEADDGDPANAEVTFFTVGTVVYLMINHAEGDGVAAKHAELATMLGTLKPQAKAKP